MTITSKHYHTDSGKRDPGTERMFSTENHTQEFVMEWAKANKGRVISKTKKNFYVKMNTRNLSYREIFETIEWNQYYENYPTVECWLIKYDDEDELTFYPEGEPLAYFL